MFKHCFIELFGIAVAAIAIAPDVALASDASAAETAHFAVAANAAPATGISAVSSVSAALLAVLTLVFVIAWLLRRFKLPGQDHAAGLKVIQAVSLGQKERAVLVQIKGRQLLVGVAPGAVNLLCDLGEGSADNVVAATSSASTQAADLHAPSFKAILKRSLGIQ